MNEVVVYTTVLFPNTETDGNETQNLKKLVVNIFKKAWLHS